MRQFLRLFFTATLILLPALSGASASTNEEQKGFKSVVDALPLAFEENIGQFDKSVKFISRGPGFNLYLTQKEALMSLMPSLDAPSLPPGSKAPLIKMHFDGANDSATMTGVDPLAFKTSYFLGASPAAQFTEIKNHTGVAYKGLYEGIDLFYYSKDRNMEFDFRVMPSARPEQIKLRFSGMDAIALSENGDLVLKTAQGSLINRKPIAYQIKSGKKALIDVDYVLAEEGQVSFRLGKYDVSEPLIIDPVVAISYPFWDTVSDIAVDPAGNIYLSGYVRSGTVLPATAGYQTRQLGGTDAYVIKLNAAGTQVVYATYLGARGESTSGHRILVDANGNAYVSGLTTGTGFPVTTGAYQTTFLKSSLTSTSFLTKLNPTGTALVYSTYVHADAAAKGGESITGMAIDSSGNIFLTGRANNFATSPGAFQVSVPNLGGSSSPFVAKLNAAGSAMLYATYLGGPSADETTSIAVDGAGNAYLTGIASGGFPLLNASNTLTSGIFAAKLNASGTALGYSTIVGSGRSPRLAVHQSGQAVVVGTTHDNNFMVTPYAFQNNKGFPGSEASNGFVVKLEASGALVYSSYLGGVKCSCGDNIYFLQDQATHVAIDPAGYAYVGGAARSRRFPAVDAIGGTILSIFDDAATWPFVAKVSPLGDKLIYSSTFGARSPGKSLAGLKVDASGSVYAAGTTGDGLNYQDYVNTIPMTTSAPQNTGLSFIFKLATGKYPTKLRLAASPILSGESVTFIADVQSTTLGGTVSFFDGTDLLGMQAMENGVAKLTTTLARGSHKITATYSADGIVSPPIFQIVNGQ